MTELNVSAATKNSKGQNNLAIRAGISENWGPILQISLPCRDPSPCLIPCYTQDHTSVPAKWHLILSRVHECDTRRIVINIIIIIIIIKRFNVA